MTQTAQGVRSDIGRFAIVPLWLLESDVTPTAIKLFAIMAAKYADREDNSLYPSRKALTEAIGAKSTTTVDTAIDSLVSVGALRVEQRQDSSGDPTTNHYTLIFARPLPDSCETGLPEDRQRGSTRKLHTEPEGLLEPESLEPYLNIKSAISDFSKGLEALEEIGVVAESEKGYRLVSWLRKDRVQPESFLIAAIHLASEWGMNARRRYKNPYLAARRWAFNQQMWANEREGKSNGKPGSDTETDWRAIAATVKEHQDRTAAHRASKMPEVP